MVQFNLMKRMFKVILALVFLLIFAFVTGKLFFGERLDNFLKSFKTPQKTQEINTLTIGVSSELTSLSPLNNATHNRQRLFQIYEGLVKIDRVLKIEPALAVSFGSIDDLTWEFRLRPNVLFHDFSKLTIEDVIFSIEQAKNNPNSEVSPFLANVAKIEKLDNERLRVITKIPDPLMMQKFALIVIFPKKSFQSLETKPIGTGSYKFESLKNGELSLSNFTQYWGEKPDFAQVTIIAMKDREERKMALITNSVDVLSDVPPEFIPAFSYDKFKLLTSPTLESNFLLFGFNGPFKKPELRKAVSLAFDRKEVARLAFGFAKPGSQFVGNGVFGYDPSIGIEQADIEKAFEFVKKISPNQKIHIKFDLPLGFQTLAQFIKGELERINFKVETNFIPPQEFEEKVMKGGSDLFFFGWRFELGDSASFLVSAVHSKEGEYGKFNAGGYRNPKVDFLIEDSEAIISPFERLEKLRGAMKIIVKEDIIGIPLFIPEALYAAKTSVKFQPRIDGYIFASEIRS